MKQQTPPETDQDFLRQEYFVLHDTVERFDREGSDNQGLERDTEQGRHRCCVLLSRNRLLVLELKLDFMVPA
jgi:hypothetical protein